MIEERIEVFTAGVQMARITIATLENTPLESASYSVLTVELPSSRCSSGTAESRESPLLAQYLLENIIIAGCMDSDVIFSLCSRGD